MRPLSFLRAGSSFGFQNTKPLRHGTSRAGTGTLSLVGLGGGDFGTVRDALFLLGAQTAIGAEIAVNAGLRIEDAVCNALSSGFDPIARRDQV